MATIIIAAALAFMLLAAAPAAAGTLRVGTVGDYPPFNYIDDAGELTGFDIDIARALCARLEARCLFQRHPWPMLIPELLAGTFDAIVASMSITEERRRVVAFTDRYYSNVSRFVTSKGSDFRPDELAGRIVGALRATIASDWLDEYAAGMATIELYDSQTELLHALARARVDAVFGDMLGLHAWLMGPIGSAFTFVGEGLALDEGIGIAVRQGDEDLRLRINAALRSIIADGTYRRINARYFPFSIY
ncbi:MAG: transporter substrate-binding domain-containing protein [Rhodospirillales bacterium]|nr:transporter substrate-binding domain-containing protein [Rhodospirillales bacterium]